MLISSRFKVCHSSLARAALNMHSAISRFKLLQFAAFKLEISSIFECKSRQMSRCTIRELKETRSLGVVSDLH